MSGKINRGGSKSNDRGQKVEEKSSRKKIILMMRIKPEQKRKREALTHEIIYGKTDL